LQLLYTASKNQLVNPEMKRKLSLVILSFLLSLQLSAQQFTFTPINVLHGLSDNQVRFILQLEDGRMIFKTTGNVNIFDGYHFKYIHQNNQSAYNLNAYDGFYRIYQSGDSILWVKDYHKLMCIDLKRERYNSNLPAYFKNLGFSANLDDAFMDNHQRFWLLSQGKLSDSQHRYSFDLSKEKGNLQDVNSNDHNIYLFYNTGAVVCYNLKTKKREYQLNAYPNSRYYDFKNTSMVVKSKQGFYQLKNGRKGGLFFFNPVNRSWKTILEVPYALNTLIANNTEVLISCATGIWKVNVLTNDKHYIPSITRNDGSKLNTEISTLFLDKQGGLWLGTANQGLLYHHPQTHLVQSLNRTNFPAQNHEDIFVQSFSEDRLGNIYLQTQSDIYLFKPSDLNKGLLKVKKMTLPDEVRNQLSSVKPTSIVDKRGWKWTGTPDGLILKKSNIQKEEFFYTGDGLSNNFIQAVFQDTRGDVWVSTSYGINKVEIGHKNQNVSFISYDVHAGALDGEYIKNAVYESTNGMLFFGGVNGFSFLLPSQRKLPPLAHLPVFTNLYLKGEKIEVDQPFKGKVILKESARYTQIVELEYNQNDVGFEFSALNYRNPNQTYYQYQLEGIDKNWKQGILNKQSPLVANGLFITYNNLPPGKYRLKVRSSNDNLTWDKTFSSINIVIHAPWWKTTFAYVAFGFLIIAISATCIFWYLRNQKQKLEQNHKENILLLRIRNLIAQQNLLTNKNDLEDEVEPAPATSFSTVQDEQFMSKAIAFVEGNLNNPVYSVERLSADLNMDRTGLYRKLILLLDKSPSLFIRNIRLDKAAELILKGELNISQIADQTGFSSASYLSKCFQEKFACKPSEYASRTKKST